jgi:hypothetical protein
MIDKYGIDFSDIEEIPFEEISSQLQEFRIDPGDMDPLIGEIATVKEKVFRHGRG